MKNGCGYDFCSSRSTSSSQSSIHKRTNQSVVGTSSPFGSLKEDLKHSETTVKFIYKYFKSSTCAEEQEEICILTNGGGLSFTHFCSCFQNFQGLKAMLLNTNLEENKESKLSPVLQLAQRFNVFFLTKLQSSYALPFIVEGYIVGLIRPDVLKVIQNYPMFKVYNDSIELTPVYGHDYETRSREVESVINEWRKNKVFVTLNGWRDESYEVRSGFDDPPLLKMERSATCLFGIRQYGVDINGYVHHPTKGLCMWLQKRSATKQTWPGKMDNMVGGGLASGYSVIETALKEANEEASIPEHLLAKLQPVGTVSYFFESERGLFPNTQFVYDLELPLDFVPVNQDGEVESFMLVTMQEALDWTLSPDFKTTSCPVILDFLIRHGFITSQNEPDFPQLMELLHVPLHSIFKQITIPSSHQ